MMFQKLRMLLVLSLLTSTFMGLSGTVALSEAATSKPVASRPVAPVAAKRPAATEPKSIIDSSYRDVQTLELLNNTETWVGQKISFEATFNSFSPYALDYKGAMRSSKDYVAFLIQRPDVTHHTIPLSELKLLYPRKKIDKVMDLENGDKVLLKGKVFSAALGDPWVDVDDIILLKKTPDSTVKSKKKSKKQDLE
jgi:hypothetical protein